MSIDDQIAAAGAQLFQSWKGGKKETGLDLHPDPASIQAQVQLMRYELDTLKNQMAHVVDWIQKVQANAKRK